MVFPILGANSATGGYEVSNSLRFNDDDSPYLSRTNASGGSRKLFTFSCWFKKSTLGLASDDQMIFSSWDGSNGILIQIDANDLLQVYSKVGGTVKLNVRSEMVFRDVSAWYHIVVKFDSNNTNLDLYVNGVEISQTVVVAFTDADHEINESGGAHTIGSFGTSARFWDGYLTEVHYIDGTAKAQTDFGEFDDNGVWIPKKYTGTYGTNGFFMQFKQTGTSQNSSGIGADTSGNDNHFAVNNLAATDVTEDTCTNNFMTLNSVLADGQFNTSELSEGHTFYNEGQGNNGDGQPTGTFAFNSGKWYWEVQVPSQQNSRAIGFCRMDRVSVDQPPQLHGNGFTATNSVVGIDLTDDTIDQVDNAGSHTQHASGLTGISDNDIFGVAVNLDDGNFQFYRNGSTYGSSYSLSNLSEWQEHGAVPCASGKTYQAYRFNFGNPAFSISSGNNDGKYGNFEYAPPSGYYALCTKRLAEFG